MYLLQIVHACYCLTFLPKAGMGETPEDCFMGMMDWRYQVILILTEVVQYEFMEYQIKAARGCCKRAC